MLKKLLVSVIVVCLLLALCACQTPANTSSGEEQEKKIVIGYDNCNDGEPFPLSVKTAAGEEAQKRGWEIVYSDNQHNNDNVLRNIDSFITKKVDYIFSYITDSTIVDAAKEKCSKAGIPLIIMGVEPQNAIVVAMDNMGAGEVVGNQLAEAAIAEWNGEVDLVLIVEASEVGELNQRRMDGMEKGIRDKITISDDKVLRIDGGLDLVKSTQVVADTLTAHPDAKKILIAAFVDIFQGQGAYNAAKAANRLDQVMIASILNSDEITRGLVREESKVWLGNVDVFGADWAKTAFELFDKMEQGEVVEEGLHYVPTVWIDLDNIGEYYPNN